MLFAKKKRYDVEVLLHATAGALEGAAPGRPRFPELLRGCAPGCTALVCGPAAMRRDLRRAAAPARALKDSPAQKRARKAAPKEARPLPECASARH